jgi:hypothetical protein
VIQNYALMPYVAIWRRLHGVSVATSLLYLDVLSLILLGSFIGLIGRPMLPHILFPVGALNIPSGGILFLM